MHKIAIAGDWHSIFPAFTRGFYHAMALGADAIVHVGDFGYTFHPEFLDHLKKLIKVMDMPIYFIRGNHDNREFLDSFLKSPFQPVEILPGATYIPDGAVMDFGHTTIAALGGAYSIDRQHRVAGQTWWLEEEPSAAAVQHLIDAHVSAPVMITHDLPHNAINTNNRHNTIDALPSRQLVQQAIDAVRPHIVFHGHQHTRATQDVRFTGSEDTFRLETLNQYDGTDHEEVTTNMVLLDTDTLVITA